MSVFVWHPLRVFLVAGILFMPCVLSAYTKIAKWVCGVAAGLWTLYGVYETYFFFWRSETGDMAIRIDLIILGPLVLGAALVGMVFIIKGRRSS